MMVVYFICFSNLFFNKSEVKPYDYDMFNLVTTLQAIAITSKQAIN